MFPLSFRMQDYNQLKITPKFSPKLCSRPPHRYSNRMNSFLLYTIYNEVSRICYTHGKNKLPQMRHPVRQVTKGMFSLMLTDVQHKLKCVYNLSKLMWDWNPDLQLILIYYLGLVFIRPLFSATSVQLANNLLPQKWCRACNFHKCLENRSIYLQNDR